MESGRSLRPPIGPGRSRSRARERFSAPQPSGHDLPDFDIADPAADDLGDGFDPPDEYPDDSRDQIGEPHLHDECYACPVGAAYAGLRGRRPEGMDRLANALADLAESLAGAVEALASEGRRRRPGGNVEHIDVE